MAIILKHIQTSIHHTHNPSLSFPILSGSQTLQVNAVAGDKAQQLIQSGEVRPIRPKDAAATIDNDGYKLLDIRPEWERDKAACFGINARAALRRGQRQWSHNSVEEMVHFGYIGLWTGQYFTMINPHFVQQMEMKVPDKSTKLLVACGEGLRSLMAVSKLHEEGYCNIGWLAGGFNQSKDEDFASVEGSEKLQYATIGGASYYFLQLLLLLQAVGNDNS